MVLKVVSVMVLMMAFIMTFIVVIMMVIMMVGMVVMVVVVIMEMEMMIINNWIVIIMDWSMINWLDWECWSIKSF